MAAVTSRRSPTTWLLRFLLAFGVALLFACLPLTQATLHASKLQTPAPGISTASNPRPSLVLPPLPIRSPLGSSALHRTAAVASGASPSPVGLRIADETSAYGEDDGEAAQDEPATPETPTSQCLHGGALGSSASDVSFDLVILVLSSRQKQFSPARRREAVRRSWVRDVAGSLGDPKASAAELCAVRHYFVVGGGRGRPHVWHDDVLVLPAADGYTQILHKVIGALRWALVHLPFKYVLKTDDDSFVCAARLLELLRALPRERAYVGVVNLHHKVITAPQQDAKYERWRDPAYVVLFNRTVYAPYMQGAGYALSADLAALVVRQADTLPTLPAVEDAFIGAVLDGSATPLNRPANFRHKNRDDYAVTVCEEDTEFVLLHKLDETELARCHAATQRRRSERCPRGPCACRSLGHTPRRPKRLIATFEQAAQRQAERVKRETPQLSHNE